MKSLFCKPVHNVIELTDNAVTDEYKIFSNDHITETCKAREMSVKNTASMEFKTE